LTVGDRKQLEITCGCTHGLWSGICTCDVCTEWHR